MSSPLSTQRVKDRLAESITCPSSCPATKTIFLSPQIESAHQYWPATRTEYLGNSYKGIFLISSSYQVRRPNTSSAAAESKRAAMAVPVEAQAGGDAMFYVMTIWLLLISMITVFSSPDGPKCSPTRPKNKGRGRITVGRSEPSYLSWAADDKKLICGVTPWGRLCLLCSPLLCLLCNASLFVVCWSLYIKDIAIEKWGFFQISSS